MKLRIETLFLCGCAGTLDARIEIFCPVGNALVYVDEALVGRASNLSGRPIRVMSGRRRVELRADGYFNAYREVKVAHNSEERVTIALRKVPEGETGD
jgi:hypothetical protein